jgi:predicted alpha/beta hydrolase family esterase
MFGHKSRSYSQVEENDMIGLLPVLGCEKYNRKGDVIFVHGLAGHSWSTWHPQDQKNRQDFNFWLPWLGEELQKNGIDVGIWTFGYEAARFQFSGSAMPRFDQASNLLEYLEVHDIGERPLIFITHSMGGLLVKEAIRTAQDFDEKEAIIKQIKGIVFLSTPHTGSHLAKLIDNIDVMVRPTVNVKELKAHAPELRSLNDWYRQNVDRLEIATKVFYETRPVQGILVVDEDSANPGIKNVKPVAVPLDHNSIAKPQKNDLVYLGVRKFIKQLLPPRPQLPPSESNMPQQAMVVNNIKRLDTLDNDESLKKKRLNEQCETKKNREQEQSSDKQVDSLVIRVEGISYDKFIGDKDIQEAISLLLKKASGDYSVDFRTIEKGSIKITLDGSQEGLKRLAALIQSGELGELKEELEKLGLSIEDANLVFKENNEKNVSVDDDNDTESSNQYKSKNILSGADVGYSKLSSANSKELQKASYLTELAQLTKRPNLIESSRTVSSERNDEMIFKLLFGELKSSTKASESNCHEVATRIVSEVMRICNESKHIQASGDIKSSAIALARHRLSKCMRYYQLGLNRGRIELHSTLSAIIYRYINPPNRQLSYQGRLSIIEDFLQNFYLEALNACRRENKLESTYLPQTLLEFAEYMAFTERYAKRRIHLPGRQQQLIILRAQTFSQQQPPETCVDIEKAAEGSNNDGDGSWEDPAVQQLRSAMASQPEPEPKEEILRDVVSTYAKLFISR